MVLRSSIASLPVITTPVAPPLAILAGQSLISFDVLTDESSGLANKNSR